jgi:membrane protein DedA with SNARE-associated domain
MPGAAAAPSTIGAVPLALLDALLDSVGDSGWTYVVVFVLAMVDAFFPVVPSETALITAGVAAATGDVEVWGVVLAAAAGAVVGDNISFGLGHTLGERLVERLFTGSRRRHLEWAETAIEERGGYLIVIGRFIPGGRTAITFACGTLDMHWHRFIRWDVLAGAVWAAYGGLLGYFGGKTFEEEKWKGLVLAFAIAFAVAAGVELVRWYRRRRVLPER